MLQVRYSPLNKIIISGNVLLDNFEVLQSIAKNPIIPVLKSNAYGHGIELVGRVLEKEQPPFLAVDGFQEVVQLRNAGVSIRPLCLGAVRPETLARPLFGIRGFPIRKLNIDLAVSNIETVQAVAKYQPQIGVHLFIDTGMRREGILVEELSGFLEQLKKIDGVRVAGLLSHFSDADRPTGLKHTVSQRSAFIEAYKMVRRAGFQPSWVHLDASAGVLSSHIFKGDRVQTASRAGLAFYGYVPSSWSSFHPLSLQLRPALEYWSTVVQQKQSAPGSEVGYSRTYKTKKDEQLLILPTGYADGFPRQLSNKGVVRVQHPQEKSKCIEAKLAGAISMNLATLALPAKYRHVSSSFIGTPVQLISSNSAHKNSLMAISQLTGLTLYQLLVGFSPFTRRELSQEN